MKKIIHLAVFLVALIFGLYIILFPPPLDINNIENSSVKFLFSTKLLNESFITSNPYRVLQTKESMEREGFCAVKLVPDSKEYYLKNYETEEDAKNDNSIITHKNKCGACSSLQDLAVYILNKDLTRPVRKCATLAISKFLFDTCLERLGFSQDCIDIWYYNTINTYEECLVTCVSSWMKNEQLNEQNGNLNECINCDEIKSGPIFKRYAGRTRRNSGIISEIGRKTEEIYFMNHSYLGVDIIN